MGYVPFADGSRITQAFGVNPADYARFGLAGHGGLDIVPVNASDLMVCAVEGGQVSFVNLDASSDFGLYVIVTNKETRRRWLYAHLSDVRVVVGYEIERGFAIGVMGATGSAFGVHLHLALRYLLPNGQPDYSGDMQGFIDPAPVLKWLNEQELAENERRAALLA